MEGEETKDWRANDLQFRKMTHGLLNPGAARLYVPYQNLENLQMMNEMLEKPTRFVGNIG